VLQQFQVMQVNDLLPQQGEVNRNSVIVAT